MTHAAVRADTRKLLGAVIVIAANSGGAWTPIGDVTTTMLWVSTCPSGVVYQHDFHLSPSL